MFFLKRLAVAVSVMLVIGLFGAACAGDGNAQLEMRLADVQGQVQQLQVSLDKAQLIATMDVIDTAGFHGMDEDLQKASEINPRYLGTVRKVERAVVGTTWPEELKEKADAFLAALHQFEAVLDAEDLVAAKGAATEAHETQHELSEAAWPYVAGEEAPKEEGHD